MIFYNRERSLNFFFFYSVSQHFPFTLRRLCVRILFTRRLFHISQIFFRGPTKSPIIWPTLSKQNRLLFGKCWAKTEKHFLRDNCMSKRKKMLIATVRDHYLTFAIFWPPLFFIVISGKRVSQAYEITSKINNLKGQCHEIFLLLVFFMISFPPAPE